jgi:hypothetical protein
MSVTERSREYALDRHTLYRWLVQPPNWPRFYNSMTEVMPCERFQEPGDEVTFRYRLLGRTVEGTSTLLEWQEGERFVSRAEVPGLPEVKHHWTYEDCEAGTRVTVVMDTPPVESFFGRVIDRYIVPRQMQRDLEHTLDTIDDLVAAGLPD